MNIRRETLLSVRDLRKVFPVGGGFLGTRRRDLRAVDGVSFDLAKGETLGLVGESGCGKSTLARCIARLTEPNDGQVIFAGDDIAHRSMREMRPVRQHIQLIFQDPMSSLNPRKRVGTILRDALRIQRLTRSSQEEKDRIARLLDHVGLPTAYAERFPRELSGGQRQRIGIARALALQPSLIVADEPVSALDVSVQAQILNLMKGLQDELALSYLFITHNLSVVAYLAHEVAVMYLGRIVERGSVRAVLDHPLHPYTRALLSAVPVIDPESKREVVRLQGELPSPVDPPAGCHFHPRCPHAMPICRERYPGPSVHDSGHVTHCHLFG